MRDETTIFQISYLQLLEGLVGNVCDALVDVPVLAVLLTAFTWCPRYLGSYVVEPGIRLPVCSGLKKHFLNVYNFFCYLKNV